eukprot:2952486-Pyramimonas_sp.AAC.2
MYKVYKVYTAYTRRRSPARRRERTPPRPPSRCGPRWRAPASPPGAAPRPARCEWAPSWSPTAAQTAAAAPYPTAPTRRVPPSSRLRRRIGRSPLLLMETRETIMKMFYRN